MSAQQFEYEVMRELEERQHDAAQRDAEFARSIVSKWPSVLLWPGKEKSGYCLSSDNGNGFAPSSEPNKEPTMANINDMIPSNYLKQSDFPDPLIVTVRGIEKKNIAMDGKPADYKWLCKFAEFDKPMVLNTTNIHLMAKACGSEDTDDWIGKEIIVYVDENVSFGGELVGGLRIRKHQAEPQPARRTAPASPKTAAAGFDADGVPFD